LINSSIDQTVQFS